jgi:hypothetical protein
MPPAIPPKNVCFRGIDTGYKGLASLIPTLTIPLPINNLHLIPQKNMAFCGKGTGEGSEKGQLNSGGHNM